ncbi:TonB-dependent receptor [Sphingomonas lenta]|uniref:TonB-dependent receptor n=1 Tax=Sphingomonas lenta TaxID=1141887 RepID=A0A2A2SBW0_9SPHN|nr:TonB-dependent receptor [Sphingomonas lenta]PAX06746.1 TonB-dependent receptor [Sphingomonas lenta]
MATAATGTVREAGAREIGKLLKCGVSATAICAFALAAPAWAQTGSATGQGTAGNANPTAQPEDGAVNEPAPGTAAAQAADTAPADEAGADDIVVTGIRQSLANAQSIKRNADTVVDAITAQDIGALPDRSVTEALQRVPGVSINRFAGSNDPDHFSVEGSGVVVRGLNFVRSEFNGRSTFSAGIGGQAINFADVPAELLGAVEVYKNSTADLIEGGLAGTVNLNTRKPFDNRGFHIGGGVEANYGDFRKKWTPTASLLLSNTWETDIGTFGLLGNVSYSRLKSRADGIQVTNIQTRDGTIVTGANGGGQVCRNPLPASTDTSRLPANGTCGFTGAAGADGFADLLPLAYAPVGGQFRTQDYDRKRDGQALAVQWESTDKRTVFTAQFLRTHSTNAWGERTFETAPDLSEYNTYPYGCQQNTNGPNGGVRAECPIGSLRNYEYDEDGLFERGYITLPGTGWRTASSGQATTTVPTGGIQQSLSRRQVFDENLVKDAGFNLKTELSDRLSVNLDVDYTYARHDVVDFSVFGSTFADQELDISGDLPVVIPHKPLTLAASWATPNPALVSATDEQYFQNRDFQFWRAAMDHIEHSEGSEYQIKGDFAYKFDDGSFLNRVKFGARYAERQQTVRYTAYNWGAISEVWSGSPVTFNQGDTSRSEFYDFPNFFRGDTPGPIGGYYYNGDLIDDYFASATYFQALNDIWRTTNGAGATNRFVPASQRQGVIAGTSFLPEDIQPVRQQDSAAYVMLNFGSDDPLIGGIRVSGNIGVRYVNSAVTSGGRIGVPTRQALGIVDPFTRQEIDPATGQLRFTGRCDPRVPEGAPPGTPPTRPGGICNLGAAGYAQLQQFANGETVTDIARNNYDYFLPSANLKLGLSDDLIMRLAASKVLTRPDLANIRNFITVGTDPNSGAATATAGNPFLKPATAWQFDATLEWYFARVGSLTLNGFYKSIDNFFYQSLITRNVTSNGVTLPVIVRGPANFDESGKIKGFEVSYQQTYDFLPGLLSGLGFSGNYSYIDSKGLPNSLLNAGTPVSESTIPRGNLPLEGLSKHNVNATVFYEKGPVSLRAAYNWRSRFLLTAADVIFPFTSIFNDETGQLDASAFININRYIKLGVQGVNLTNEVTRTLQAYTGDPGRLAPRSYFVNDRRFSFILRGNF